MDTDATQKKSRTRSIANRLNGHFKRRDFFSTLFIDLLLVVAILVTWALTTESLNGGRIFNVTGRRIDGLKVPETIHVTEWFTDVTYNFYVEKKDTPKVRTDPPMSEVSEVVEELQNFDLSDFVTDDAGGQNDLDQVNGIDRDVIYVSCRADTILTMTTMAIMVIIAVQLFFFVIGCFTGKRTIKRYLRPIDEIALTAERISAESVSSEKQISSMRQENHAKMRNLEASINGIGTFDEQIDIGDSELGGLEAAVNNMLKRLAESNRKQIRFVDDASHELRTPIAVIQGYVNMLDRWGKDDPKVMEESISAIKAESEHMKTLVDQLLFLARGDADRLVLSEEKVSLAALTEEIYEESVMIDKNHEYKQILPEEDAEIAVDVAMFKQCIRILIDNAAKYTPACGTITIKSYVKGDDACIEVTDTGEGISKEDIPHIFDRFYRSASARGKQGSGLGLSIAKWIVEKHNGRIDALSREGTGTRMTVVIQKLTAQE